MLKHLLPSLRKPKKPIPELHPFIARFSKKLKDPTFKDFTPPSGVTLDEHQLKACFSPYRKNLVIAGAGSGKTRVITQRIATLINLGVSPLKMKIVTFTNKATVELKERLMALTSIREDTLEASVSTIHKLAIRTLK